jgi:Predicted integral membrane protein (DUF2269)
VTVDDWALALHVLSGFALVAAIIVFWVLILAVRQTDTPDARIRMEPVVRLGNAAFAVGSIGTIVLGVWLAFSVGDYEIWNGWIIAALVLWAFAMWTGQRTGAAFMRGANKARELQAAGRSGPNGELLALNRTVEGALMHFLASVAVVLILVDMIWKPGA